MNKIRRNSSPDSSDNEQSYDDSALEGVAANVKLLLKLIQDHKSACDNGKNDGRRMLRVATMMSILDSTRTRIQTCQSFGNKNSEAKLRRCNSDLKPSHIPKDKRPIEQIADEKSQLRKQLNASLAARKSLEIMCSSLGKEKEIMATELAKKVHELNEMDELINDLKAQNANLLKKVQDCAPDHKEKKSTGSEMTKGNIALQERNKALSDQLLRSLDGYRSMKRRLKEAQEENLVMRTTMEEIGINASISLEHVRGVKDRMASGTDQPDDVQDDITKLEHMIECLEMQVPKHGHTKGECVKMKGEINACQHSVVA